MLDKRMKSISFPSKNDKSRYSKALMHNSISQANFITKARFEDANCIFNPPQISKAAQMQRILPCKQHEGAKGFIKFSQT